MRNEIVVGIDGDHAYALLGENLQVGKAEFVKITEEGPERAMNRAELALRMSLYPDQSHGYPRAK